MSIIIDGQFRVLDAAEEAENLARLGFPAPANFALANSVVNPLGAYPLKAYFLMLRSDLNAMNSYSYHTAIINDNIGNSITVQKLVFIMGRCITPGKLGATDAAYLVEFADPRWLCHNPNFHVSINAKYNVRAPAWGATSTTRYYLDTMNSGTPWTWAGMVGDIWALMSGQLGAFPGLPLTPDGTPEAYIFPGMSAWVALNQVLYRIGCAVKFDPTAGAYSIVQIGAADAAADKLQAQLETTRKIHDEEFQESVRGRAPFGVRVYFHGINQDFGTELATPQNANQFLTKLAVYHIDVAGPDASFAEPGTYHEIWDDEPALYDANGVLQNSANLDTRATDRALRYFAMIDAPGGTRLHKTYAGLAAFVPGSTLKGVSWRQDLDGIGDPEGSEGGFITEIVCHPFRMLRGVNDQGQWVEDDAGSVAIQAPDYRPTFPIYPPLMQEVQIQSGAVDAYGRYSGILLNYDCVALTTNTGENVWIVDMNGASALSVGTKFPARLVGYNNASGADGRPLYRIRSTCCDNPTAMTTLTVVLCVEPVFGPVDMGQAD